MSPTPGGSPVPLASDDVELTRVYDNHDNLLGAIEYDPETDRYEACTVPLTVGGKTAAYSLAEAVGWIQAQARETPPDSL